MKIKFDPNLAFQKLAIGSLNPMCIMRYSTTHVGKYH